MADFLGKIGLDKLDRALIYGVIIAVILVLLTGAFEPTHAFGSPSSCAGCMWRRA